MASRPESPGGRPGAPAPGQSGRDAGPVGLHPPRPGGHCFGDEQERASFADLVERDGPRLVLRRHNGEETAWQARHPANLERILGRADLTRRQGFPVVLAHPGGLMAFAAGPGRLPDRVAVLFVVGLAEQVLPAAGEGQPSFFLLDTAPLP